jgi:hypothetical protein
LTHLPTKNQPTHHLPAQLSLPVVFGAYLLTCTRFGQKMAGTKVILVCTSVSNSITHTVVETLWMNVQYLPAPPNFPVKPYSLLLCTLPYPTRDFWLLFPFLLLFQIPLLHHFLQLSRTPKYQQMICQWSETLLSKCFKRLRT